MNRGKKYKAAIAQFDRTRKYSLAEAVEILRKTVFAKFNETVEAHIRLGVDPRNADQQVRGTVALPHGTGKTIRVLVFAEGEEARAAQEAGADFVGAADMVEKINGGWLDFDACVSTPALMREVGKLGRVLGPRGLMPNPKTGTVTTNVSEAVKNLKAGQVEYRVDRTKIVHAALGKMSFTDEQIVENIQTYLDALIKARPASVKGAYIRSISVCSAMSPGVKVVYNSQG